MNSNDLQGLCEAYNQVNEGLLDSLDKTARDTAGKLGGTYGREKASKVPGANLPILGDIIKNEGERRGRNQGQKTYDDLKNKAGKVLGGVLKQEYEPDANVVYEMIISHLLDERYASTAEAADKIILNMSESWFEDIMEKNRYEKETGKDYKTGKPVQDAKDDKAYTHVKRMMRGMEGKPEGQRKKEPGKKPPKAGEYGGPKSPEQKVKMRRAAAERSKEMMHSARD